MGIHSIDDSHILGAAFAVMSPIAVIAPKGMAVVLVVTALGLISVRLSGRWTFFWPDSTVVKLLTAFVMLCFLSATWSIAPEKTLKTAATFASEVAGGTLIVFATTRLNSTQRAWAVRALCVGLTIAMAALIFEYLSGNALRLGILNPDSALSWEKVANFNEYNASGSVVLLTALPTGLLIFRLGHRLITTAVVAGLVVLTVLMDADSTRVGLMIGVAVAAGTWWAPRIAAVTLAAALSFGILAGPAVLKATPPLQEYADVLPRLPNSTYHRLIIWEEVVDRIWQRPIAGFGFDSSRNMTDATTSRNYSLAYRGEKIFEINSEPIPLHPHNTSLQVWLELGGLGAILYTAFLIVLIRLVGRYDGLEGAVGLATLTTATFISFTAYGAWQSWWQATLWMVAAAMALAFAGKNAAAEPSEQMGN